MKNILFCLLILAAIASILPGCKKSTTKPEESDSTTTNKVDSSTYAPVSLLAARWSIIRDTVTNVNGYTYDFYTPPSRNYIGGPNDYLNFTAAGVVSGSEDSVSITGTYTLSANNSISLSMLPAFPSGKILTLTANNLIIAGTNGSGNSSITDTIYLNR
jgi:hypothetical protein